uniref:Putative secreted protein n=1 Tax=Ixodes ricinus TaxID=34613 RepID=A0A6B0U2J6_IXORI
MGTTSHFEIFFFSMFPKVILLLLHFFSTIYQHPSNNVCEFPQIWASFKYFSNVPYALEGCLQQTDGCSRC